MSIFSSHRMKIARKTLKMTPSMALVMGGMTYEEAYQLVFRHDLYARIRHLLSTYGTRPVEWELEKYGWQPSSLLAELKSSVSV